MYIYIDILIYMLPFQTENGSPCNFPFNLFTVCSSCKQKLVVCPFVYKETNGRYIRTKRTYPFMLSSYTKKYASTGIITGMLNFS